MERAFAWFVEVEAHCSRFDPNSDLRQLIARAGSPVKVSTLLLEAVEFALELARDTDGAFDPAVGARMENHGFDRNYQSGASAGAGLADASATFEDIIVDAAAGTIQLKRPLVLDLGAVAKGMAIDLAAQELRSFGDFAIDAGGDLYVAGCNALREPWRVGVRNPARPNELIETLRIGDAAVCTSGRYERGLHILDARTGTAVTHVSSATVIAPTAMAADALATAAFVLGPDAGVRLLERHGVEGAIWTGSERLNRHSTSGYVALLSHA
jgi:thiamine biosynthesis lipoprotein